MKPVCVSFLLMLNKLPHTWWLKTTQNYLIVLKARSPKSVSWGWGQGVGRFCSFLRCRGSPFCLFWVWRPPVLLVSPHPPAPIAIRCSTSSSRHFPDYLGTSGDPEEVVHLKSPHLVTPESLFAIFGDTGFTAPRVQSLGIFEAIIQPIWWVIGRVSEVGGCAECFQLQVTQRNYHTFYNFSGGSQVPCLFRVLHLLKLSRLAS